MGTTQEIKVKDPMRDSKGNFVNENNEGFYNNLGLSA